MHSHQRQDILMNQQSLPQNRQPAPERPTDYIKEMGESICGRLVEDESLRSICAEPGMPDVPTVSSWISNNGEFRDMYALAREFQAHCIADEVIELVDEVSTEWVEKVRANGRVVRGPARNLPRYRLRIEVRHWVADQLLARARQLSARTLFELPTAPDSETLQAPLNSSHIVKGHRND
jgi:hypothetical protein